MNDRPEYTPDGIPIITEATREKLRDYVLREYNRGIPKDELCGSLIERIALSGNEQIKHFMEEMIQEFEDNNPDLEGDYLSGHADGFAYAVVLMHELFRRQTENNKFNKQFRLD